MDRRNFLTGLLGGIAALAGFRIVRYEYPHSFSYTFKSKTVGAGIDKRYILVSGEMTTFFDIEAYGGPGEWPEPQIVLIEKNGAKHFIPIKGSTL